MATKEKAPKPKTTFSSFAQLAADLGQELDKQGIKEAIILNLPVKVAAINHKPYLQLGPFWIKSNAGSYDIYIWNPIKGGLQHRCKVSYYAESATWVFSVGFNTENWLPVFDVDSYVSMTPEKQEQLADEQVKLFTLHN